MTETLVGNRKFAELYCDGGVLGPNDERSRGVYWSLYVEGNGTPPVTIRKQDRDGLYKTNNDAEWLAVREALRYAVQHFKARPVVIYSDSRWVINQFNGKYTLKFERHKKLYAECRELARQLDFISLQEPKRPKNPPAHWTKRRKWPQDWRPRDVMLEKLGH